MFAEMSTFKIRTMKYLLIICLLFPFGLLAQNFTGTVANSNSEPLNGASIVWKNTTKGTTSDEYGQFEISGKGIKNKILIASFVGHSSDTVVFTDQTYIEFVLTETQSINEVVVSEERDDVIISNNTVIKTEVITEAELGKSACCDLAGCFETQITVQPHTTNIITNSKELRILGLSGVYNQVLIDGFPMIQGLSYTYGISGVPGTLVQNIHVSKGANSVLQGYESISGQINVITKSPEKADKLFLNAYINGFAEKQFNANLAFKKNKWSNITAFHVVQPANKVDRDNDDFIDLPQLTRYMVFNKLKYGNQRDWGLSGQLSLRLLNENRVGGQTSYNPKTDLGSTSVYGQSVNLSQPEVVASVSYRINDFNKITLSSSSFYQEQESYLGTVKYDALQTNFYGNLQYERSYAQKNSIKTGVSYRYLNLSEDINFTDTLKRAYAGNYNKLETVPGVFAENTMFFLDSKITWIAGVRGDLSQDENFVITPRTLLKYNLSKEAAIRASVGTGWRTANVFSENIGLLVSSKDIIFEEELNPEKALNWGLNYTHKFKRNALDGYLSLDFYRTDFQNQVYLDYDTDPTKVFVKNFTGTSVGNGVQAEIYVQFWKRFKVKTGYNYLDVYREFDGVKEDVPFNAKHRFLATFNYEPLSQKFSFDVNVHWHGVKRLPSTKSNPVEFQRPDYSDPYTLVNTQFTYFFKKFEVYTGCENVFDFVQEQAISSWENPFGPYFDTSSVWGPTKGREFYVGLRFKLK